MRVLDMVEGNQAVLDGSGNATVELTCDVDKWNIQTCGLLGQPRPFTNEPECVITIDGRFVGGSLSASLDNDSTFNQTMNQQQKIKAVWTGGDPGKTVILSITGTKVVTP